MPAPPLRASACYWEARVCAAVDGDTLAAHPGVLVCGVQRANSHPLLLSLALGLRSHIRPASFYGVLRLARGMHLGDQGL
jgi:hypothetical protein